MNGKQLVTSLDRFFLWIMRLAAVNGLWILYSLYGLLIAGVFPATVAAFGVSRKWIMGDEECKLWQTFRDIYRKEFIGANILGWILTIMGFLLYSSYKVLADANGELLFIIPFIFYFTLFFYTTIVLWTFPLLAHYQATWLQHLKNALIIGVSQIHYTIASGIVIMSIVYVSLEFPGFIPFFSISLMSLGCMWFAMQLFKKVDNRMIP